jgi:hypothetical protein
MQANLRKHEGTSLAKPAGGLAIARQRCIAISFSVDPGMVNTK